MSDLIKTPEILQPAIRQYKKTCDDALISAFHYEKTKAIVAELEAKNDRLEAFNNAWRDMYFAGDICSIEEIKAAAIGDPDIIDGMKYDCNGEYNVTYRCHCEDCESENDADPECHVCDGEYWFDQPITLNWTLVKKIFMDMSKSKARIMRLDFASNLINKEGE